MAGQKELRPRMEEVFQTRESRGSDEGGGGKRGDGGCCQMRDASGEGGKEGQGYVIREMAAEMLCQKWTLR